MSNSEIRDLLTKHIDNNKDMDTLRRLHKLLCTDIYSSRRYVGSDRKYSTLQKAINSWIRHFGF